MLLFVLLRGLGWILAVLVAVVGCSVAIGAGHHYINRYGEEVVWTLVRQDAAKRPAAHYRLIRRAVIAALMVAPLAWISRAAVFRSASVHNLAPQNPQTTNELLTDEIGAVSSAPALASSTLATDPNSSEPGYGSASQSSGGEMATSSADSSPVIAPAAIVWWHRLFESAGTAAATMSRAALSAANRVQASAAWKRLRQASAEAQLLAGIAASVPLLWALSRFVRLARAWCRPKRESGELADKYATGNGRVRLRLLPPGWRPQWTDASQHMTADEVVADVNQMCAAVARAELRAAGRASRQGSANDRSQSSNSDLQAVGGVERAAGDEVETAQQLAHGSILRHGGQLDSQPMLPSEFDDQTPPPGYGRRPERGETLAPAAAAAMSARTDASREEALGSAPTSESRSPDEASRFHRLYRSAPSEANLSLHSSQYSAGRGDSVQSGSGSYAASLDRARADAAAARRAARRQARMALVQDIAQSAGLAEGSELLDSLAGTLLGGQRGVWGGDVGADDEGGGAIRDYE
jgi:hypothetical protein